MSALPVHETFHSWQGEGIHAGRSAYFIRLHGCPVHCPWCDSAGTWHPDYLPETIERVPVETLVHWALAARPEFVVITGGEPTIHNLTELTGLLRKNGLPSHLETSGAFPIKGTFDWITLSPKWQKLPLAENLDRADELKLIVDQPDAIERWMQFLRPSRPKVPIWLHPEWSRRNDPSITGSITEYVKREGSPFRAGVQAHKYFGADADDAGHREDAPLGGDPSLGY